MSERTDRTRDEICWEHSGHKTMIFSVMMGVAATIILLGYNTFFVSADIRVSLSDIRGDLKAQRESNQALAQRVTQLESIVFKKPSVIPRW